MSGVINRPPPALAKTIAGFAWAGLAACILAGWFVVTRFSVTHDLRIWDITLLRFGGGGIVLLPVFIIRRHQLPRKAWRTGFGLACLWGVPFVLFVALGLRLTSAGQAAAVTPCMMPVFAGLFRWLVWHQRPTRMLGIGYAGIVAGVTLMQAYGVYLGHGFHPVGLACLLASSALWAIYTMRFPMSGLTPIQAAAMVCVWSAIVYTPFFFASGISRLGTASFQEVALQLIYQGGLMSVVAVIALNRAITVLGAGAATAVISLIPVIATLMAIPALGEVPPPVDILGIAMITAGVLLAIKRQSQP
jgi:drug/metabolite transporter (DMT)-like permease